MKQQEIIALIKSGIFKTYTTKEWWYTDNHDDPYEKIYTQITRVYIDGWRSLYPVGLSVEGDRTIELSDGSFVFTDDFISSLKALLKYAREHEANAADKPSYDFIDTAPGEKSFDGGEYGFYTHFRSTPVKGVYILSTSCTCGFDACGTGLKGLLFLTKEDLEEFEDPKRFGNLGVGDGIVYEWARHLWKTPHIML